MDIIILIQKYVMYLLPNTASSQSSRWQYGTVDKVTMSRGFSFLFLPGTTQTLLWTSGSVAYLVQLHPNTAEQTAE